tara:strand:+ start:4163 stop:4639 length:477 start_codon:yes stop_codon:yes gene_type:complete
MKIVDNFLPSFFFDFISERFLHRHFAWYFQKSKVTDDDGEIQFTHLFYDNNIELSKHINLLEPILKQLKVKKLLKAKVNLTLKEDIVRPFNYHVDIDYTKGNTAILYMNTNNGKTLFKNGKEVNSVANRMLIFANQLEHTGTTHTDTKYRIVLNINYL